MEFWSQVDDPLFSDEMVLSKMSIVVNKTLGLILQRKPPNIGGHVFTAVLSHLVSVKERDEDIERIMKQISLAEVTFDQRNEESVMSTVMSVFKHLDEAKLPALAKTTIFQKKMVDLFYEKLQKSLRKMYNTFLMKMMEYKAEVVSVENLIEAFSHVGSMIFRDDSKAAFWTQSNPSSSNSQVDRPQRENDWQRNK